MNAIFADTFYYLALVSGDDAANSAAVTISQQLRNPIVTTAWVLAQVGDALAAAPQRGVFRALLENLRADTQSRSYRRRKRCSKAASNCTFGVLTKAGR